MPKGTKDLPHNTEAEKAVLGAMLKSTTILANAFVDLSTESFFEENENHRVIFSSMKKLYEERTPVDVQTVTDDLINSKQIEVSGGAEYLLELVDSIITFENINEYIRIVRDQYLLRKLLKTITEISNDYYTKDIEDISDFLSNAEKKISNVTEQRRISDFQKADVISSNLQKEIDILKPSTTDDQVLPGNIPTGFSMLNQKTHGLSRGSFVVVAARTGVGKTAFALNLTFNAAVKDVPVAYFSLEMPATQLFKRLVSADANVLHDSLVSGYGLNDKTRLSIKQSCDRLAKTKIYVDDSAQVKVLDILAKIRKLKSNEPDLGLVVVDHIGLVSPGQKLESRQMEVQYISQMLKKIALELNIVVIGVCQIKRLDNVHSEPGLQDLRESGSIEQDADLVLIIHESKVDEQGLNGKSIFEQQNKKVNEAINQVAKQEGKDVAIVNIIIAKNRSGQQGKVPLLFRKNYLKFDNMSKSGSEQVESLENERISFSK